VVQIYGVNNYRKKEEQKMTYALMREWVGKFGVKGSVMTDNGGEFNSDEVKEIISILNIQVCKVT
jgi:hypothetical protein